MKTVVLGVTGSIAAYKSLEITRKLVKANINVIPVFTPEAKHFVTPLSFQSLCSNKVHCDFFKEDETITHISLSEKADVIGIVPATANFIGKLANGIVDNLLLGIVFAAKQPVLIAPAMNNRMWMNKILIQNIDKLKKLGYNFIGPITGSLASLAQGLGRLEEPEIIVEEIFTLLETRKHLKGKRILITIGRTKEYLDPVRFISNDSSGKFGLELTRYARRRGAEVEIIAGYTDVDIPHIFNITRVTSTEEMKEETMKALNDVDIIIMNAACSDFTPRKREKDKIKKKKGGLEISLSRTTDILSAINSKKSNQLVVGFSLDTKDNLSSAKKKMKEKGVDIMVANPATAAGSDRVKMTIINGKNNPTRFPDMDKSDAAEKVIETIVSGIE
jgi:phosphopantothenoylcysteine decarboxylase/phosphopantothenate--cysteine ligase